MQAAKYLCTLTICAKINDLRKTMYHTGIKTKNFDLGAQTAYHWGYGYFVQKFSSPAQNLGAMGNWATVNLFPATDVSSELTSPTVDCFCLFCG